MRPHSPLFCLLLLSLLGGCVSLEEARQADALAELGLSYIHEGNNESAIRELMRARDLNPRDAKVRHYLGLAFFARGVNDEAEKELKVALKLDPKLSEARLNLASLYIALERYPEALPLLKEVTRDYLYRSPARAWNNLGWVQFKMGQDMDALASYREALRIAPRFCQALENMAVLYEKKEDAMNQAVYLERATEACPDELRYWLGLSQAQLKLNRRDDAVKNLQRVAEKDPKGELGAEARARLRNLP